MPVRPPQIASGRLKLVGVLALLFAVASGWYVVALEWSLVFLLSEGRLMAIYSLILLLDPALFAVVAIQAFRGKHRSALLVLAPLGVKWVIAFEYAFIQGAWELLWANLPVVSAISKLADEFLVQFRPEQSVMLILQFYVEPVVFMMKAVMLRRQRHPWRPPAICSRVPWTDVKVQERKQDGLLRSTFNVKSR